MRTYIHAYTYIYTYIPTYANTYIHAFIHVFCTLSSKDMLRFDIGGWQVNDKVYILFQTTSLYNKSH